MAIKLAFSAETRGDGVLALGHDFDLIRERGQDSTFLTQVPLWPKGAPGWVDLDWPALRTALESTPAGWQVWTAWYQDRLDGRIQSVTRETAYVTVPDDVWAEGPEKVNAEIIRRFAEHPLQRDLFEASGPPPSVPIVGVPIATTETLPAPIEGVFSAVDFAAARGRPIRARPAVEVQPVLKTLVDKRDHKPRLDLCRDSASKLLDMINQGRFNVRGGYRQALSDYVEHLPASTRKQNILFADQEARILRDLFAADADILSPEFAAPLKAMLQAHQGLRVFYPGLERFYDDVRFGRTSEPLPIDAAERIADIVQRAPDIFDFSVVQALSDAAPPLPAPTEPPAETGRTDLQPPPDPMGSLPTEKAQAYARAGIINRLWEVFERGEKINKNIEGWIKMGQTLAPHISQVIDWLGRFWPGLGDGTPPTPPPIVT
jgi:hypothetical protein